VNTLTLAQRIKAVLDLPSDRLDDLVRAAGIDPAADLRFGNWREFDLTGTDLRDFNFTGADLTGARFDNARIAGAIFDRAIYDLGSLRKAADFDHFLRGEVRRPAGSRQLSDRRVKDFEVIRDTPLCPELVVIRTGEYDNEIVPGLGKRPMRIARSFALGRYPVTFEEYDAFLTAAGRPRLYPHHAADEGWGRGRRPVIKVTWIDAQAYCGWLNRVTGLQGAFGYRLPSDSEWGYACDEWDPWRTLAEGRVRCYPANPSGLHDMTGSNVWEWCADHDADNISKLPPIPGGLVVSPNYVMTSEGADDIRSFRVARTLLPPYLFDQDNFSSTGHGHHRALKKYTPSTWITIARVFRSILPSFRRR
jgi:hypothetical protein